MLRHSIVAVIVIAIYTQACKHRPDETQVDLKDAEAKTSAAGTLIQLSGKSAEHLFAALAEGDRLDNDRRAEKNGAYKLPLLRVRPKVFFSAQTANMSYANAAAKNTRADCF